ncbi:MAG: carbohydrate kinase family protein [Lutispora sp.]|nr:carbohydrate kinase family protein [Lutispora sp.]MDD4835248.1 carbohydrate kinase family protein [Lutispora sp.]
MNNSYIAVVGGANVDIQGFPYKNFIPRDSNPGNIKISLGGVGRNIGENLVKLGVYVKLISVIGDDIYGCKILGEAKNIGLDMKDSLILEGEATSTYLSILDEYKDMAAAVSSMEIYEKMTVDFIKEKRQVIDNSKICIIDTNIPREVIEYIVTTHKETDFFLDTVSTTKAKKIKDLIGYFHTIKPNRIEAQMLTGIEITNDNDLKKASEYFLERGVKRVFISLGDNGVFYNDGENINHIKTTKIKVTNATGAGDAFIAALAYGHYYNIGIEESTKMAIAASILTLSHEDTINPSMSIERVKSKMEEIELC